MPVPYINYVLILQLLCLALSHSVKAQTDSCWTVLLLKEGRTVQSRPSMSDVNDNGFYLYRNCIYDIELTSGKRYLARLQDIRKDTLVLHSHFNEAVARNAGQPFDTLYVPYTALNRLFLIADRAMGWHTKVALQNYTFSFQRDTMHCALPILNRPIYTDDTTRYALTPYLTQQGLNWLYEANGKTYYYMGMAPRPVPQPIDTVYRKKAVWFIPSLNVPVDEVNGLAFGLMADPSNGKEFLRVKGVCIEMLGFGIFAPLFGSFLSRDSILFAKPPRPTTARISGFNLNLCGAFGEAEISGFYIGGGGTLVNKLRGLSISGIHIAAHEMRGVCISALRNQSHTVRGVQLGLFNSGKDVRGIQIGLWNKNQRRSLPLINWSFK